MRGDVSVVGGHPCDGGLDGPLDLRASGVVRRLLDALDDLKVTDLSEEGVGDVGVEQVGGDADAATWASVGAGRTSVCDVSLGGRPRPANADESDQRTAVWPLAE